METVEEIWPPKWERKIKEEIKLPRTKPFFYTLEQVLGLVGFPVTNDGRQNFLSAHCYREGLEEAAWTRGKLRLINFSRGKRPDWKVADDELIRWVKHKKLRYALRED